MQVRVASRSEWVKNMSAVKLFFAFMVFMVLLVSASPFFVSVTFAQVDEKGAAAALAEAESKVASAFEVVSEAERAGADVSGLLVRLNDAAEQFAKAENAYRVGDFEAAAGFASVCVETSDGVKAEANELLLSSYSSRYTDAWFRVVTSVLGVTAVGVGGFGVWRIFRRRYYRRVLEMKPEVASGES